MAYDADAMTLVIAEAAGLDPDDKGDRQVIDLILDEYYWIIISGLDVAEMNIEVGRQQISERNGAYLLYNDLKRAGVFEVTADGPVVGKKPYRGKLPEASELTNSVTVQSKMDEFVLRGRFRGEVIRPFIDSNGTNMLIDEIMKTGMPVKDTFLPNGLRWDVPGRFRGAEGNWELVINMDNNLIVHFNFKGY